MDKRRLKTFEGQQVVLTYNSRIGAKNSLNAKLMFVGQDSVIINIGRKEISIPRAAVIGVRKFNAKTIDN